MSEFNSLIGFEGGSTTALADEKAELKKRLEELKKQLKEAETEEEKKKIQAQIDEILKKLGYPYPKYPERPAAKAGASVEATSYGVVVYLKEGKNFEREGNLYKKEVLYVGKIPHPQSPLMSLNVDEALLGKIVQNTKECGRRVPITINHPEGKIDPRTAVGEVKAFIHEGDSLYALMEIRDAEVARVIDQSGVVDCSIGLRIGVWDDNRKFYEIVADHVALTLKPALQNLEPFEKIEERAEVSLSCLMGPCFAIERGGKGMKAEKVKTKKKEEGRTDASTSADFSTELAKRDEIINQLTMDLGKAQESLLRLKEEKEKEVRERKMSEFRAALDGKGYAPASREALLKFAERAFEVSEEHFDEFVNLMMSLQLGSVEKIFEDVHRREAEKSEWMVLDEAILNEVGDRYAELRRNGIITFNGEVGMIKKDWNKEKSNE